MSTGFSLSTIRNLLSIVVACEKVLDSLHSERRIGGSTLAFTPQDVTTLPDDLPKICLDPPAYNLPWSARLSTSAFLYAQGMGLSSYPQSSFGHIDSLQAAASRFDIPSWLQVIRNAPSVGELIKFEDGHGHGLTVNLDNLDTEFRSDEDQGKITVEFRQHAGTLQAAEVLAWVDVCMCLMEFANSQTESDIAALCEGEWSRPAHNANDFLATINVTQSTKDHYAKVIALDRSKDEDYGTHIRRQELDEAGRWPLSIIDPLVRDLIRNRCGELRSDVVAQKIHEKFKHGCYGRFTPEYLAHFPISAGLAIHSEKPLNAEQRARLTIGHVPDTLEEQNSTSHAYTDAEHHAALCPIM